VPREVRDAIVAFISHCADGTEIPVSTFLKWLGLSRGRYYRWVARYGHENQHNAPVPRRFWLLQWEREAIIQYALNHPLEGYRRLTFMMLDEDVVACSPSSVYRVLKDAGLIRNKSAESSRKGQGFNHPDRPHKHWHIDIAYLNVSGTFYYLCSILDGYSRMIVHWEIREQMCERDVEIILQRAKERYPLATPRVISDNGPQFIAKDFKEYIRLMGMTHVRTSPFYPQSNGKLERWHKSLKQEVIRPKVPLSLEDARCLVGEYVSYYNTERLHSAIGYITPQDKMEGRAQAIFEARREKLARAQTHREQCYAANNEAMA
jgi:putative transposase